MTNAIYPKMKQSWFDADADVSLNETTANVAPFCALIDTGTYTYSAAHQYYNADLTGKVGTDMQITTPTIVGGLFDGDNLTYTSVSGNTVEALVIYRKNAGADTTWRLVFFLDITQVTPNGGNITVTWDGAGIVQL